MTLFSKDCTITCVTALSFFPGSLKVRTFAGNFYFLLACKGTDTINIPISSSSADGFFFFVIIM